MTPILLISHSLLGDGIRSILERSAAWQILHIPPAAPEELIEQVRRYSSTALVQYDGSLVTILDVVSLNIQDLFQDLGQPGVARFGRIIVVTPARIEEETLFFLMKWGVAAYVSAAARPDDLVSILHQVLQGAYLLTSANLHLAPQEEGTTGREVTGRIQPEVALAQNSPLSAQETRVLSYIAQGMAYKMIARSLKIKESTVKNHVSSIHRKLHVTDRTGAVVYALLQRWIPMPEETVFLQATRVSVA